MLKKIFFLFVFLSCLFCLSDAKANLQKEEVLFYRIDAVLNKDASLDVQETIKVRAQGVDIKRGIYRDFSLKHAGGKTPVLIQRVTRNGENISYKVQNQNGNKRVYLGDMNKTIPAGIYEYKISYKYNNIIRQNFTKTKDEFYHNLIGNEWNFDIAEVEAVVYLPQGLNLIEDVKVFTGKYGSKKENAYVLKQGDQIFVRLPNGLKKRESMTLRTVFNSGFFKIPEKTLFLDKRANNLFVIFEFFVLAWVIYYMYSSWKQYGKDGVKRPVFPRYDIPKFNELGALLLLKKHQNAYIDSCDLIMPHLAHLSQKGLLKIESDGETITIQKNEDIKPCTSDEKFFLETAEESYSLEKGIYDSSFSEYVEEYKKHSMFQAKRLFKNNKKHFVIFGFSMFIFCVGFFLWLFKDISLLLEAVVLSGVVFAVSNIVLMVFARDKNWITHVLGLCFHNAFICAWCLGFFGGIVNVLGLERDINEIIICMSDYKIWCCVFLFACFVAFYKSIIIRIYDIGLGLIEHLEGIEMFLKGTDDLKYKTPKQAEMEKLLPYAILLGLQNQWVEKMETCFNFVPPQNDVFRNSDCFSKISSSFRHSVTKPSSGGSSSGFSGGGCSGGGSGGGGGGGF